MEEFKSSFSLEYRQKESKRLIDKHPGHFPIFLYKQPTSTAPHSQKTKFLVSGERTMGDFIYILKKQHFVSTGKDESIIALFFFAKNHILNPGKSIGDIYNIHKDEDGFLYIEYSTENTFG